MDEAFWNCTPVRLMSLYFDSVVFIFKLSSLSGDSITLQNKSLESVNRLAEWNTHVPAAFMNSLFLKPLKVIHLLSHPGLGKEIITTLYVNELKSLTRKEQRVEYNQNMYFISFSF